MSCGDGDEDDHGGEEEEDNAYGNDDEDYCAVKIKAHTTMPGELQVNDVVVILMICQD